MTRATPRTNFNSSRLIRFLAGLAVLDVPEPDNAFAEKLGLWLDFTDAITLSAAHNAGRALPPASSAGGQPAMAGALEDELDRRRTEWADAINRSCSPGVGGTRLKWPVPQPGSPLEIAAAYEPYRRFYLAHQRDMETNIGPLRARVRSALASASPALATLANLDAAFDGILSERESRLLATVPLLLEKRFVQLYKAHQQRVADAGQEDSPATWMQPGAWLAVFCRDLQALLLAELDLRLQPTMGLIEAFSNEVTEH